MMEQDAKLKLGTLIASALVIAACGGGGGGSDDGNNNNDDSGPSYDGQTSAAQIDTQDNAKHLGRASAEGARKARGQDSAPALTGVTVEGSDSRELLKETTFELIQQAESKLTVSGVDFDVPDDCGSGNAVFSVDNDDINSNGGFEQGALTYNDYCAGSAQDGATINGTVNFNFSYDNSNPPLLTKTEYDYDAVEVTDNATSVTRTINMSMACNYNNGTLASCTFSEAFTGINGVTYKIENVKVTGNGPYGLDARVFHPDYGYIDIRSTTDVTYGCNNGMPDGGVIKFSDGTHSVVVSFLSNCNGFTVSYNGVSTVTVNY